MEIFFIQLHSKTFSPLPPFQVCRKGEGARERGSALGGNENKEQCGRPISCVSGHTLMIKRKCCGNRRKKGKYPTNVFVQLHYLK